MSHSVSSNSLSDRNERDDWLQTRPGERCLIRVPAADTNGVYSFVEIVSDPGDGTPLHVHQNEDEYLFVLEGTVRLALGRQDIRCGSRNNGHASQEHSSRLG